MLSKLLEGPQKAPIRFPKIFYKAPKKLPVPRSLEGSQKFRENSQKAARRFPKLLESS